MARINPGFHPKLTEAVVSILHSQKIYSVYDLMSEDSNKLMTYSGLSYQEVLEVKAEIVKKYVRITKGSEPSASEIKPVPTGISSLDVLLSGGLRAGQIYEIAGLSGCGKSQLCHTLAVNIADSCTGVVHYVDTKGDFSAERTQMIVSGRKSRKNSEALLMENIRVTQPETVDQLMNFLHSLKSLINVSDKSSLPRLVMIDSLPALFFDTTISSDSRSSQATSLNFLANVLRYIAKELRATVVTVNLISQWRGFTIGQNFSSNSGNLESKPFLGQHWLSIPNTRFLMEIKDSSGSRKITVSKSTYIECGTSCCVNITNSGVV